MTFSNQIKIEIGETLLDKERRFSCLYGILLFARTFTCEKIRIHSESSVFNNIFKETFSSIFGTQIVPEIKLHERAPENSSVTINICGKENISSICSVFGIDPNERHINIEKISNGGMSEFLAGVFLCTGSISDPSREYRVEFNVPEKGLADDLISLLLLSNIKCECAEKKNSYIIYIENSENIEDILTFIGARQATIDLINIKIYKNVRNRTNRVKNCDLANINKTLDTAYKQAEIAKEADRVIGLDNLPQPLKEVAILRIENMHLSSGEIGQMLENPVGRSAVTKRFNRIKKLTSDYLNTEEKNEKQ